jgi:hypothetical protein
MKKSLLIVLAAGAAIVAWADWPSAGGGPTRDNWAKAETALSPASAKDIKFLYTHKFDNTANGESALETPVLVSRIITWKGFKALMFVGSSNGTVYSMDSDLGRDFEKVTFGKTGGGAAATLLCPGGMTASIAVPGSISAGGRGGGGRGASGRGGGGGVGRGASGQARGGGGGGGGGGRGRGGVQPSVYAVGADGTLRWVREQDNDIEAEPAAKFVPANARLAGLAVSNNTIYAATEDSCGGNPNGLYALDISMAEGAPHPKKEVASFMTNGPGFAGDASVAIGADGTVFGQVAEGNGSVAGKYDDTVLALSEKTLEVKDYFTPSGSIAAVAKDVAVAGATPAVFEWNGKEIVVAGSRDGKIYLLDAKSLGGADHHTPLASSAVIAAADNKGDGNGIWNSFATDTDASGARWIYASINGPSAAMFATSNGAAPTGAIVALKVEDHGGASAGKPALTLQWISRDLISPAAPVVGNGLVYALSTGKSPRSTKTVAEHEKLAKPAVIYVLDAATGKELFSGAKATTYATSGVAIADGQFYYATHDNTVYAWGIETLK